MIADWLSVMEASHRIMDAIVPVGSESCALMDVRRRVLAEPLVSPIDLPVWTNSAMDGFAVRAADVAGASAENPVALPISGDVPAGASPAAGLEPGTAVRVTTGAPVPPGADTVIRKEHTDDGGASGSASGGIVRIFDASDSGKNLRLRGEELRRDEVALVPGRRLDAAEIGVAASLGYGSLRVHRRPIVGVLTSGDELVEVEDFAEVLAGRKIVSSNSYTLRALIDEAGCTVRYLGIARDSLTSVRDAVAGAAGCDALVTSAGVSVGDHDYVRAALQEFDTEFAFWRVRMRPGSPFAFGTVRGLGGIPWFGLPGNPVSTLVTGEIFLRPALLKLRGEVHCYRRTLEARVQENIPAANLTQLLRVRFEEDRAGSLQVALTGAQGSGMLSSMAAADGLLVLPEKVGAASGDLRRVVPLREGLSSDELLLE